MDYSKFDDQNDFSELIPQGTLAWAILRVRPFNADANIIVTPSKSTDGNGYLDMELTIKEGRWKGRKIWTRPGVAGSSGYVEMGGKAIRAILECGRGASAENQMAYSIESYAELDGLTVGIKVKEEHQANYPSKNDVAVFLSPMQNKKDWTRLLAGDFEPDKSAVQAIRKPGAASGSEAAAPNARWANGGGAPAAQADPEKAAQQAVPAPAAQVAAQAVAAQVAPAPAQAVPATAPAPVAGDGAPPWLKTQG